MVILFAVAIRVWEASTAHIIGGPYEIGNLQVCRTVAGDTIFGDFKRVVFRESLGPDCCSS